MNLFEHEGKKLFKKYGILVPEGMLVSRPGVGPKFSGPYAVKAQVTFGDRARSGGILFADDERAAKTAVADLLSKTLRGERVKKVLVEQKIAAVAEYYISFSYSTDHRAPVLAATVSGGTGTKKAEVFPVDVIGGLHPFFIRSALLRAGIPFADVGGLVPIVKSLWNCFFGEYALLAEINPLMKTPDGKFVAADAKVVLDDEKIKPGERRFIDMDGDIAILASGGGASLLNIDALLKYNGWPANYTEYSGNPPKEVVRDLTKRVLARHGLKGLWVIGGTANFTDIYETMVGFIEGLREVKPKPTFPIVIRRDGPRGQQAFRMLREVAKKEGYRFTVFDGKTSMAESAKRVVALAYRSNKASKQ
ncbi:MAG: ATP citrate lyase citrate-binding domain-containing protein [bacterium]|nr:ATP citrate lyase citrate-binding domain-containing protein [bacterium]